MADGTDHPVSKDKKSIEDVNAEVRDAEVREIREPDEVHFENDVEGTWREKLENDTCLICGRSLGAKQFTCGNCGMDYSGAPRA